MRLVAEAGECAQQGRRTSRHERSRRRGVDHGHDGPELGGPLSFPKTPSGQKRRHDGFDLNTRVPAPFALSASPRPPSHTQADIGANLSQVGTQNGGRSRRSGPVHPRWHGPCVAWGFLQPILKFTLPRSCLMNPIRASSVPDSRPPAPACRQAGRQCGGIACFGVLARPRTIPHSGLEAIYQTEPSRRYPRPVPHGNIPGLGH